MNNINNILEKYWNAEASLQEEAELRQYFSSQDVAEEHIRYKGLFQHIETKRTSKSDLNVGAILSSIDNIDELLAKYWNVETTLEEEKILKSYFSGGDVDARHKETGALFSFYNSASQMTTDIDLSVSESVNSNDIDALLSKYWNAETSLEEENVLKAYFASSEISEHHKEYQNLFSHIDVVSEMTTDLDLRSVLSEASNDIDTLLEKYFNAETSLEEENVLAQYFTTGEVAAKHQSSKELFQYYANQKNATTDINLEQILESQNSNSGNAASDNTTAPKQSEAKVFSIRKMATAIAAIFVLGFAAVTVMNQASPEETKYKGKYVMLDEEAEAQEAYEITMQAFALLSKNMNQGSKTIQKSVKKAKKASIFK